MLPADSSFWSAPENEGTWPEIGKDVARVTLPGPGLSLVNYGANGTSELQPGKVRQDKVFNIPPYYNRLAYNTGFLCEADSPEGGTSMQYSIKEIGREGPFLLPNSIAFFGERDKVLYRQLSLQSHEDVEGRIDLADIAVPFGVIRVDRLRAHVKHELNLGHYGLPCLPGEETMISRLSIDGRPAITASAGRRHLALVAYHGWTEVQVKEHQGLHPEAFTSRVIYAKRMQPLDYAGMDLLVTILLHKIGSEPFQQEELALIHKFRIIPFTSSGQPCGAEIEMVDGKIYCIDFKDIEGNLKM
jgi:hypothetical protein